MYQAIKNDKTAAANRVPYTKDGDSWVSKRLWIGLASMMTLAAVVLVALSAWKTDQVKNGDPGRLLLQTLRSSFQSTITDWQTCNPSTDTCATSGAVCCIASADWSSGKHTCRPAASGMSYSKLETSIIYLNGLFSYRLFWIWNSCL